MDPSRTAQAVAGQRRASGVPSFLTQPLTDVEVASWLSQPERPGARWEAQLLWNIRTAFKTLVSRGPSLALNPALLGELYQQVTSRLSDIPVSAARNRNLSATPASAAPATWNPQTCHSVASSAVSLPSPLRRTVLILPDTVYVPPADPGLIDPCFEHVLRQATAITDPAERSFFLLVHLLYLLPFGTLNATMALLTANVPLLSAGLPPVTFAGVAPSDLLAGLRGVWELGQIELLRDAFLAQT
jgi:hypothetical protein